MKIVFRVDASTIMGTGHVMRCRTLATALRSRGANILFITRAHAGHLGDTLESDGFSVAVLRQPKANKGASYSEWLGVSQQEDADETVAALPNEGCDWLIVDHYGIDEVWEAQLQSYTRKLFVIDDLANRQHACDVLLDQNYAAGDHERYLSLVPADCQLLLGPRYALLRSEYSKYRETMAPRGGAIKHLLVYMGGADNQNVTGKVLTALSQANLLHLEVDIVIGTNYRYENEVIEQAKARPNTHIHGSRPHLADLMEKADLAVGAGGATTWERLCMGLPSLVISIAENQVPACEALALSNLIRYLGPSHKVDSAAIEAALLEILADAKQLNVLKSCTALVDGLGVNRTVEVLYPTTIANLTIRRANSNDALTYFTWVNDPIVRSNAINSAPIAWDTHLKWFSQRLSDPSSQLYVLEAGELPVGQVRFECRGGEATIDYSLDVTVRGRGWASQLLTLGIEAFDQNGQSTFKAIVKPTNLASVATFKKLDFVEQHVSDGIGNRHFKLSTQTFKMR